MPDPASQHPQQGRHIELQAREVQHRVVFDVQLIEGTNTGRIQGDRSSGQDAIFSATACAEEKGQGGLILDVTDHQANLDRLGQAVQPIRDPAPG